jgi:hypothetical protein
VVPRAQPFALWKLGRVGKDVGRGESANVERWNVGDSELAPRALHGGRNLIEPALPTLRVDALQRGDVLPKKVDDGAVTHLGFQERHGDRHAGVVIDQSAGREDGPVNAVCGVVGLGLRLLLLLFPLPLVSKLLDQ